MTFNFKITDRIKKLGKTQAWLVSELRKRGIEVPPTLLSNIIDGTLTHPKAEHILLVCDEIVAEVER